MEMKANICKIVTLARKMVVEHKREQQEMLKFLTLVSGSYKDKDYRTESRYSGDFLFNMDFYPFKNDIRGWNKRHLRTSEVESRVGKGKEKSGWGSGALPQPASFSAPLDLPGLGSGSVLAPSLVSHPKVPPPSKPVEESSFGPRCA
ncbi:G Patch Domain-Containing Protein 1 [Manis pentadactyla]|nr:G Patch Domain-Containing Protein 1 [Manis pentadactyla]